MTLIKKLAQVSINIVIAFFAIVVFMMILNAMFGSNSDTVDTNPNVDTDTMYVSSEGIHFTNPNYTND